MASTTVSTPLYPLYEARFGLTALAITVVFAAYGVGVMGGLLVAGRLSDHIGRRPPLEAGLVIGLVAMALFVAANDLGLLLAARLLIGVTAGLFTGTATAWLVDLDADRQRATKLAVGANLGGLALGPALGGVLAQFAPDPLRTTYVVELVLMAGRPPSSHACPRPCRDGASSSTLRASCRRARCGRSFCPRPRRASRPSGCRGCSALSARACWARCSGSPSRRQAGAWWPASSSCRSPASWSRAGSLRPSRSPPAAPP